MVSDHPPFKLMAPYKYARPDDHELVLEFCDVSPGEEVWVGLYGGVECAVYDMNVYVHTGECHGGHDGRRLGTVQTGRKLLGGSTDDGSSTDAYAATETEEFDSLGAAELVPGILHLSSCEANSFVDFYLPVRIHSMYATFLRLKHHPI